MAGCWPVRCLAARCSRWPRLAEGGPRPPCPPLSPSFGSSLPVRRLGGGRRAAAREEPGLQDSLVGDCAPRPRLPFPPGDTWLAGSACPGSPLPEDLGRCPGTRHLPSSPAALATSSPQPHGNCRPPAGPARAAASPSGHTRRSPHVLPQAEPGRAVLGCPTPACPASRPDAGPWAAVSSREGGCGSSAWPPCPRPASRPKPRQVSDDEEESSDPGQPRTTERKGQLPPGFVLVSSRFGPTRCFGHSQVRPGLGWGQHGHLRRAAESPPTRAGQGPDARHQGQQLGLREVVLLAEGHTASSRGAKPRVRVA